VICGTDDVGREGAQAERRGVLRGRLTATFATDKRYAPSRECSLVR